MSASFKKLPQEKRERYESFLQRFAQKKKKRVMDAPFKKLQKRKGKELFAATSFK